MKLTVDPHRAENLGYAVLSGPAIAGGEPEAERSDPSYRDVVLERRLRQALVRLNPDCRRRRWKTRTAS